jgi:hypothetical protein
MGLTTPSWKNIIVQKPREGCWTDLGRRSRKRNKDKDMTLATWNVRPRLRRINDVEDDLRKLGVKRWRTKALDREEWASIIREAKAKLKGP